MASRQPIRVAIVGGGVGAITAAFELTRPQHRGRYQVTVYQLGWRLGGKGASGRRRPSQRVEEHGLHLWLGFYENAFRLLRECYAENGRRPGVDKFADWRDAIKPDFHIGVAERMGGDDGWNAWTSFFPPAPGLPGDPIDDHDPFTIQSYMVRSSDLLRTLLVTVQQRVARNDRAWSHPGEMRGVLPSPEEVIAGIERMLDYGRLTSFAVLLEASFWMREAFRNLPLKIVSERMALQLIDMLRFAALELIHDLLARDRELVRLWEMVDLVLAICRGVVRNGLLTDPRGFDTIDDYDFREWIVENGASRYALDSAFLQGPLRPGLRLRGRRRAPASHLGGRRRCAARPRMFFTYRGSFFWKMQAGMGDVVFAPFYEVLSRRGVRFEFFHRLRERRPVAADHWPDATRGSAGLHVQARAKEADYDPLVDVKGLPCWPAEPDWELLRGQCGRGTGFRELLGHHHGRPEGAAGRRRLRLRRSRRSASAPCPTSASELIEDSDRAGGTWSPT